RPPGSTLFPYTTLFRSGRSERADRNRKAACEAAGRPARRPHGSRCEIGERAARGADHRRGTLGAGPPPEAERARCRRRRGAKTLRRREVRFPFLDQALEFFRGNARTQKI